MRNTLENATPIKRYSIKEEVANGITHGLGVLFGFVALTILLVLSIMKKEPLSIVSFSIYGSCIILMYLSSTLYHSIPHENVKKILRVFDHSSIYLFIAGTYTPIALLTMDGALRIGVLVAVWSIALFGITFKISTYKKMDRFKKLSLGLYLFMGWIAVFTVKPIIQTTSFRFFVWILVGGLLYTLGTIFYAMKKIPYSHAVWHVFVLSASVVHFLGIFLYLA
ncbi:PAQR family membrane homeostasis protein TrhA [Alkaliphilus oremlandii]|uniref:Channel protein, hemolysin III family n=1 Tax=Alkaliphilus oremlandii (strain OhILAs) TaxID=350688 RepID=A8MLP4_ALKOO|nr:hemolysin III family protein [Alkaliphilus oremlandii]ABW17961.1 channel protein, hemolysin III family [Alkaliphilus oremlandii OhILAs]